MKFRAPASLRHALEELSKIRQDGRLVLWTLVVQLYPFYFFSSGLPQPADALSLLLMILLLRGWSGRLPVTFLRSLKLLIMFVAYVVAVNLVWSFTSLTFTLNAKDGYLLSPTFYVFNGLMLFTFLLMYQRYGEFVVWLTARLVLVSTFVQVFASFALGSGRGRSTVMFNNPNQLGYYALLSACILLVGQKRLRLSTLQVTAGLAACAYLALISASKAALTSIAALGIALLLSKVRTIVVASLVFGVLIFTENPFSAAIDRAQHRIDNDQSLSFFEERGYDRILAYPEYWMMGAGEGGYRRFTETSAIGAHELHSSMATLFFCYGIVGTLLFSAFLWTTIWGAGIRIWLIIAAGLAYGMTHQGLRFRLLWLLMGMVLALRDLAGRDRAARLAAREASR